MLHVLNPAVEVLTVWQLQQQHCKPIIHVYKAAGVTAAGLCVAGITIA